MRINFLTPKILNPPRALNKDKSLNNSATTTFSANPIQLSRNLSQAHFYPPLHFPSQLSQKRVFDRIIDNAIKDPKKYEYYINRLEDDQEPPIFKFFKQFLTPLINKGQSLDSGAYGEFFRLTKKYSIKVNHNDSVIFEFFFINRDNKFEQLKNIWYGEPVAHIGGMKVLRNANPDGKAITAGLRADYDDCREYYNNTYLPRCSKLPQEAFDKLAFGYDILNKIPRTKDGYYAFDTVNPNNFLLDETSIKIVDDMLISDKENPNKLSKILKPLLNEYKAYVNAPKEDSKHIIDMQKEILKKSILASERVELPLCSKKNEEVNRAFYLIGHTGEWEKFRQELILFRENTPNINERINKISNKFDEMFN